MIILNEVEQMEEMSIAMQNYLELIYELSLDGKKARVSDIAKHLGVSKPSVNNAVVVLAKDGYVIYEKYADVKLTPKGKETAEFICGKHQTKGWYISGAGRRQDGYERWPDTYPAFETRQKDWTGSWWC